jgi:hypothetical protein
VLKLSLAENKFWLEKNNSSSKTHAKHKTKNEKYGKNSQVIAASLI